MENEKKGLLAEVIYYNDENGYCIAVFEDEEDEYTGVGYLPGAARGRRFKFAGKWKEHSTYGRQFAFSEYEEELPETKDGIELFLASGAIKGVGEKMAAVLVGKFGENTLKIIEDEPQKLIGIPGIGKKKAESICKSFLEHKDFADVTLFFQQYGISPRAAMKFYKTYGLETIAAVKENPYRLVGDISGIGFRSADKIAMKMGIEKNSEFRIKSAIKYILWFSVNDGNTFLPKALLLDRTVDLLDVSREEIEEMLLELTFEGDVQLENLEDRPVVFLEPYYFAEQIVCKHLIRLKEAKVKPLKGDIDHLISIKEEEKNIRLSDNQKYAVKESLGNGVFVITGGPGTGKTTIINSIISIFEFNGLEIGVAAPTGRAAKRITETTGHEAFTIHRMLEYYYSEGEDSMRFGKTEENPLNYDAIIIDEASMIDIILMKGLLQAIPSGTRFIIVGDEDQLPSVGAGNVLRDILNSEIIHGVRLTEIFRQAKESLIIVNAHKINRGEHPEWNEKDKDFFLLRRNSEDGILQTIKELCAERLPKYYKEYDPVKDIQVMTPVRKGVLGSINLNKELQTMMNPMVGNKKEKTFGDKTIREGDKVMQIKNNYQLEWKKNDDFSVGEGVFNGDVGYVHSIDGDMNTITVVYDEVKFVQYEFSQVDELELAYSITVHKSQGSEFPIVIMPMAWFPPMLATRNLLYTGVTRGKKAVILVGMEEKMIGMVENNQIRERYSGLAVRLKNFMNFDLLED